MNRPLAAERRYFCTPPPDLVTFRDLFLFIWEQGIGNQRLSPEGPGVKWKPDTLSIALDSAASPRAIDGWLSGASEPSDESLRALLDVISDRATRPAWQGRLLQAAAMARRDRRRSRVGGVAAPETAAPPAPPAEPIVASAAPPHRTGAARSWAPWAAALLVMMALVAAGWFEAGAGREASHYALKPGQRFQEVFPAGGGAAPELILLPRGTFVMGSPETEPGGDPDESRRHSVTINYRMAVGVTEVTWDEYELCVADGACAGYLPDDMGWGRGQMPVTNVSFNDVYAYLHWLNRKLGIAWERADRYTLLTEAEWEYAAFAGKQGSSFAPYSYGFSIFTDAANFNGLDLARDGQSGRHIGRPTTVASYPANAWGLHDMHGNVWEWTEDCYRPRHEAQPADGRAYLESACNHRTTKGGSFGDTAEALRAANRNPVMPETRRPDVGFRVVRRLPDSAEAAAAFAPHR
ncbi:MAG: formylglycine-generating enzyme family protein [Caulobacterales bacterium]